MLTRTGAAFITVLALGLPAPAWADLEQDKRRCVGDPNPDIMIGGCTRLVQSGRFGNNNLAIAFNNRGNAYRKIGQYDRAIRDYNEAIRLKPNYAPTQFALGAMYAMGQGVSKNYAEAVKWYRKAAEQGNARAQYSLGFMYGKGQGVSQDYVRAHMWYSLSAANGGKDGPKARDIVAKRMTPAQIAEAQKMTVEWMAKHKKK